MNIDTYRDRYITRKKRQTWFCISAIAFAMAICIGAVHSCHLKVTTKISVNKNTPKVCTECHNRKMAMSRWFEKQGSKSPDEMAEAVLATRSPKLLAKIAIRETRGNPHKRGYGYNKAHDGAFGVNRNDWGKVSKDPVEQALQAEMALNTFTKENKNKIVPALNGYGGDFTEKKYADMVLMDLGKVP